MAEAEIYLTYSYETPSSALVFVSCVGASGAWNTGLLAEGEYLRRDLDGVATWGELAAQHANHSGPDVVLGRLLPLEGGFTLALVATENGLAIDAREDPVGASLAHCTRVWSDVVGIADFAAGISQGGGATIRQRGRDLDDDWDEDVEEIPACVPLLRVSADGVENVTAPLVPPVGAALSEADIDAVAQALRRVGETLELTTPRDVPGEGMATAGGLTLEIEYYLHDPERVSAQIVVGTRSAGPLWTLTLGAAEVAASLATRSSEGLDIYGQHMHDSIGATV